MSVNSEIYLIGLAILIFLIITFLFIRKVSNDGKLKVKIEKVQDSSDLNISDEPHKNQQSFDFEINQSKEHLKLLISKKKLEFLVITMLMEHQQQLY